MYKNNKLVIGIILLVVITSAVTFMLSATVFFGLNHFNKKYDISFDSEAVSIENIRKFNNVRNILKSEYYEDVDENILIEGAVSGMADSLGDPYTVYFTKEQMAMFMEKSDGSYVGIGVTITTDKDGLLTVIEPFKDSPAEKAGLVQGDKITKVDGMDVTGIRDENFVINMIRGPENTKVSVTVYRYSEGRFIDFEMVRKKIKIVNATSEVLPGNIGYIKIIMFDSDIALYFEEHLRNLLSQNIKGIVIDVRDNPGGSYNQVIKIADRILPKGLIVYTEDKNKKKKEELSDARSIDMPIAVLINGNSASASEILAGAIKDHNKGVLVGTRTFGKGLVQELLPLGDGSGLKVTVARYFTPSGVCIHGEGIEPSEEIPVPEQYKNMPVSKIPRGDDVQLQTAAEILKAKTQ